MAAGDLTTLASVREFMQKDSGSGPNTEQDALIESLIPAASRTIMQWTGREFAPASTGVTRTFVYDGSGLLDLYPYDLRTVTAISRDSATPIALTTPTDYLLRPSNSMDGVYSYLLLSSTFARAYAATTDRVISITGNWGFASVPADVAHWCNVTIKWWITNDVAAFSSGFDANTDQFTRGTELPEGVRRALASYRRTTVV